MFCSSAEEMILENLDSPLDEGRGQLLRQHLSVCEACRRFQNMQTVLDETLTREYDIQPLTPDFNKLLMQKIAAEKRFPYWEILPDILHILGGVSTTLACMWVLPFSPHSILSIGLGGTLLSYLLQILLRLHLEELESS